MDNNSKNSRIAKNTSFLYIRMILVLLISLYTTRVILNSLGVVDYGIYNVVAGFVTMFAFLNTSMSNGIQRFYNFHLSSGDKEDSNKVYNMGLLIQILLAIIILILLESIGIWYINNKMVIPAERLLSAKIAYHCAVISLVIVILQIPYSAAIMAHERMDYFAYVSIFDVLAKLGIAIIILKTSGDKLITYSLLLLAVSLINFCLYFSYSKIKFKELKLRFVFYQELFLSMISFSGWNVFGSFAYVIKGQGLNLLLNAFFGPVVNAAQGIASMVMNAIAGFQSNIVLSSRPQLVQAYASGNYQRVENLMYSVSKISYLMIYMLTVPILIELPYILNLWLGEIVPNYTVPFTFLILIINLIASFNTPISQVVHATGKMRKYQIITSLVIYSILPISWVFLKIGFAPVSVFWVSIAITIINQFVCMYVLKSIFVYSIFDYFKSVLKPCLVFTLLIPILPLLAHFLMEESIWRLGLVCLICLLCSIIVAYMFGLNNPEKQLVNIFIHKIIKR